ncbi:MAG: AAA family ATPase [Pseudomonadota bacterium]
MPVFVCLAGLPGVGKSTIAAAFAGLTGALWLRVDLIEQAMRGSPAAPADLADVGYRSLCGVAEGALMQGFDVIGDSVNPIQQTREMYRAMSDRAGARHFDVVVECSDETKHRDRVETRPSLVAGLALPTWDAVLARHWEPFDAADLKLDTAHLEPEEAARAIAKMAEV